MMMEGLLSTHMLFKFIAHNMIMRKRTLEQRTYIVQQQLGDKHLSVCDIKEQIKMAKLALLKKSFTLVHA